jgi:hypothetical protein
MRIWGEMGYVVEYGRYVVEYRKYVMVEYRGMRGFFLAKQNANTPVKLD